MTSYFSLRFNGHFPGEPGLSGIYWSKGWRKWWWQLLTGAISRSRTKLQSNDHHQQTNNQSFLQAGCPSCRPTNSVKSLKGKYHIRWTCLTQVHLGVFQLFCELFLFLLVTLGEGCHASHQPSDASTPTMTSYLKG